MRSLGLPELMVILVVALLLFGGKIPEFAKRLGAGIRSFKGAFKGDEQSPKEKKSA